MFSKLFTQILTGIGIFGCAIGILLCGLEYSLPYYSEISFKSYSVLLFSTCVLVAGLYYKEKH
jgi:hypothetical protein